MPLKNLTFKKKDSESNLLSFLSQRLYLSKNKAKRLLDQRLVFVNRKRVWIASYRLQEGDVVEVQEEKIITREFSRERILWEDPYLLVVDKPAYVLSNGPNSLESKIKLFLKDDKIQALHRLDKDTTGLLLFAKNEDVFNRFKDLFKKREIKKNYLAIVRGCVEKKIFTIDKPIQGETAVTHVKVLKKGPAASFIEIDLATGRTHQIRIHLASVGYPIMGEQEYDRRVITDDKGRKIPRQMLHASDLSFLHPYTLKMISIKAEIPADFLEALNLFGLRG